MRKGGICLRGAVLLSLAIFMAPSSVGAVVFHSADSSPDFRISLSELLRVIQFYNVGAFSCQEGTEDGYVPGSAGDQACGVHDSDYMPADWTIQLSELLRMIQFFNTFGYGFDGATEDGFKPLIEEPQPDETPGEQVEAIREQLKTWPEELGPEPEGRIKELLEKADGEYEGGDPCGAADTLDLLVTDALFVPLTQLSRAARATAGTAAFTDLLLMRARNLQYDIVMEAAEGDPCLGRERFGMEPDTSTGDSSPSGLGASVKFGVPRFSPLGPPAEVLGRTLFGQIILPGFPGESGEAGTPWVPSVRHLIAVPPGGFVSMEATPTIGEQFSMAVGPFQQQPVDQVAPPLEEPDSELFADKPFVINEKLYETQGNYPRGAAQMRKLGLCRGLELWQVEVFAGQYDPVNEVMTLFDHVDISLTFSNGPDGFRYEFADSPFESSPSLYLESVLNREAVAMAPHIPWGVIASLTGEEFMIITHPDFRDAADALKDWKVSKGIMTNVYEAGTGVTGRETNDEIDNFIENHYSTAINKPSYILLLGDSEFIEPFNLQRLDADPGVTIGTDWPYAIWDPPGTEFPPLVPTFAVGRIPVDTLQQATDVVNKIIDYEQTPPGSIASDDFYDHIAFAAQFQCCRTDTAQIGRAQRTFTEVSEYVRARMVLLGYQVDRIYQVTVDGGCASCDPPRPAYTADPTPRRYYDGGFLPDAIGGGSGFAWDGDTADIVSAWNEGRFLIFHRDHGWPGGWGTPGFSTANLGSLTNGAYQPVVFSINCSSGLWDNETSPGADGTWSGGTYFAELLLRDSVDGAVGVIGDTRVSPSWPNSALSRGLFDAVWPSVVPSFGSNVSQRRLGDILNHAKLYLLTQIGVSGQGTNYADAYNELLLYHVIGDPTLEMWTRDPRAFTLAPEFIYKGLTQNILTIEFPTDGATITAYRKSAAAPLQPIGRGIVVGGVAQLQLAATPGEGELLLAASLENAVSVPGMVTLPAVQK